MILILGTLALSRIFGLHTVCNEWLGRQGLTADHVEKAVESCDHFRFWPGVEELFQSAYCVEIHVVILSAGAGNIIEEVVRQRIRKPSGKTGKAWENISFQQEHEGRATGIA